MVGYILLLLTRIPHTRGDEPSQTRYSATSTSVFPTHVGMNRGVASLFASAARIPHTRGDEPFSHLEFLDEPSVFPTHVGMNRINWLHKT